MSLKPMRVGVFGGTFDPVHLAHLIVAQEAYEQYDLDAVVFVPTRDTTYRVVESSYDHRYLMLKNVIEPDPRFILRDYEYTYSVELLAALRSDDVLDSAQYFLIIGGDQAGKFFTWHRPDLLIESATIVCAERGTHSIGRVIDHWGEHADQLHWLDVPECDISASEIRQRVRDGISVRYLVPPAVEQYVQAEGLYS